MYQFKISPRAVPTRHVIALVGLALAGTLEAAPLRVVATTSLIADVAREIAGPYAEISELIPASTDPHAFDPTPRDMARLQQADLILANGLGLETFLEKVLAAAEARTSNRLVIVSNGRPPRRAEENDDEPQHDHGHEHMHEHEEDPHVWFDPTWVKLWVSHIARALAERLPDQAAVFEERARAYENQLDDLDGWIQSELGRVPAERRIVVTDHEELGYFADRYGLTIVGAILPNFTTVSETSARARADLQAAMQRANAKVVVVGHAVNPAMASRLAADVGARVVQLRTHGLGPPGSGCETYLDFMRQNVKALADALIESQ